MEMRLLLSGSSRRVRATQSSRRASATLAAIFVAVACAGCADETTTPSDGETTSGGETTAELPPMRSTVPIPVPQPGRPREQLGAELQAVWERVELVIAITPPEPPAASTLEDIEAWAAGPFLDWIDRRRVATDHALEAMRAMREAPVEERAMGAALFGYLYEDTVSGIRGAPVPDAVAADPELLAVYTQALNAALVPYATMAAQAYYGCVMLFREVEDAAWSEWPGYCDARGAEIVEVFGLEPAEPADPADPAAPATPAEGEPAPAPAPSGGSSGGTDDMWEI